MGDAIRRPRVRWPGCRSGSGGDRRVVSVPGRGSGGGNGSGCFEHQVPDTGPHNTCPSVVPGWTGPPSGHWGNRTATRRRDDHQGGHHDGDLRVGAQRRPLHGAQKLRPGHGSCCPAVGLQNENGSEPLPPDGWNRRAVGLKSECDHSMGLPFRSRSAAAGRTSRLDRAIRQFRHGTCATGRGSP